jgi:hypothetical protein
MGRIAIKKVLTHSPTHSPTHSLTYSLTALLNNSYDDDDDEFERLPVKQRNNDKFSGFQGFNPPAKGSSSKDNSRVIH